MTQHVFYRKWRSQRFAELVGQEHVTRTLRNAIVQGRLAHAYVFCGPRGVGKTSAARILARVANCLQPQDGEPCGECDICVAMAEGRLLDVIEIDAASNRQIDDIRELRERIHFAPTQARYKFYILDEAHMLTTEAFNALLKTLEEPPPHAVFVLVTTDAQKLPQTIVSRCQRFDFRRISLRAMLERLHFVCEAEGIEISAEALQAVARAATGSLRDAESLLDQIVAAYGRQIAVEHVRAIVGMAGFDATHRLTAAMTTGDIAAGLRLINELHVEGTDLRRFASEVTEYLRGALLLRVSEGLSDLVEAPPEAMAGMRQVAGQTTVEWLSEAIKLFAEIETLPRAGGTAQLPVELAFVDACFITQRTGPATGEPARARGSAPEPMSTARSAREALDGVRSIDVGKMTPRVRPGTHDSLETTDQKRASTEKKDSERTPSGERASDAIAASINASTDLGGVEVPVTDAATPAGALSLEQIVRRWPETLEAFGLPDRRRIQALLRAARPVGWEEGTITLGFKYLFHRDMIEETRNRHVVEDVLSGQLGQRVMVRCTLETETDSPLLVHDNAPLDPAEAIMTDPRVRAAVQAGWRIVRVTRDEDST